MWKKLLHNGVEVTTKQLNLKNTLMNGQCFNWKEVQNNYVGIVDGNVILMRDIVGSVEYNFLHKREEDIQEEGFLNSYFQMDVEIDKIVKEVNLPCELKEIVERITGVRIIKQDVFECIMSFICSSNNNIDRIRKMLESFRILYGKLLLSHKDYGEFYSFPDLSSAVEEQTLRDKSFGYRAKYIVTSLDYIRQHNGKEWLKQLETMGDPTVELLNLQGVGQKVADCIALFSLGKNHIVPLDIHMINFYNDSIVPLDKSFKKIDKGSKKSFESVAQNYIKIFGNYAGWLHSIFYMSRIDKTTQSRTKAGPKDTKGKRKSELK
jgi:N-glycosylase/DNA lyase